ncbi:MAG: efflux RND transporter permease subunit [Candidatus Eutrophobiaceae bacterium]
MYLTRAFLGNPVALVVACLLLLIFGILCLLRLPVQLIPEVEEPGITIKTGWRGSSPAEVEADILEPQEDVLRGLPGMIELRSTARQGGGEINIRFSVDMEMRRALIEVMNRLNQVPRYPNDVDEPVISSIGANARAISWFIIKTAPGNEQDIQTYQDYVEEVVRARFERVYGVARSAVFGGSKTELRISYDPWKLADLGINLDIVGTLAGTSKDISAGFQDIGKREYSLRFSGKYDADQLGSMVLAWRDGYPVYLRDVASIEQRLADKSSFVLTKGTASIAVNAQRENGVNVLKVMGGLRKAMADLREGPLKRAGLTIEQVYDETLYIDQAIKLLSSNLALGLVLSAIVVFLFFLRLQATFIIAIAVPLCLMGAFCMMYLGGYTLNVISLAGLALSVGMVLDASIVVLENIMRRRESGSESMDDAAANGATQVSGALMASTATTVAIFLPVLFLRDESGQLFADLAATISIAICFSLLCALTVVPVIARRMFAGKELRDRYAWLWDAGTRFIMFLTNRGWMRMFWVTLLLSFPTWLSWELKPESDYLPSGNRNLAFAIILPPPGANIGEIEARMGEQVSRKLEPYVTGKATPAIKHYFFVAFPGQVFLGARAENDADAAALVPVLKQVVSGIPDTIVIARQASLFQGFGAGRTVDVNIQGRDMDALMRGALSGFLMVKQKIEGASVRPRPGLELAQPELRIIPNERRLAEAGWNRSVLAQISRTLGDGLLVGDYFDGERNIDMILRALPWESLETLTSIPLVTPNSGVLPLSELAKVERTAGPEEIQRINRRRTVTLEVSPPKHVSLEQTLKILREEVEPVILEQMPEDASVYYGGTADKLKIALESMSGSFLLAIVILYLLMSALFRSFFDSLLVLLTLPLAVVGGVMGLHIMNFFVPQNMDLLTMIGFVIMLGLVVNNAILLVYQARTAEREGANRRDAVRSAVRLRLRPILMSTLTSLFGMLPLMLMPGSGSELYRGLATVIVGGLLVSTLFTLLLLPSLLRMGEERDLGYA